MLLFLELDAPWPDNLQTHVSQLMPSFCKKLLNVASVNGTLLKLICYLLQGFGQRKLLLSWVLCCFKRNLCIQQPTWWSQLYTVEIFLKDGLFPIEMFRVDLKGYKTERPFTVYQKDLRFLGQRNYEWFQFIYTAAGWARALIFVFDWTVSMRLEGAQLEWLQMQIKSLIW